MSKTLSQVYYFNSEKKHITSLFKKQLVSLFEEYNLYNREVIILCIGSDRSTGDSLGPLVGHELSKYHLNNISIYGTLEDPVHAANLSDKLKLINDKHVYPFIIAIDASLGTMEHIGFVTIGRGPLRPGLGVSKKLPSVGDIHITGIVNFSGMMESLLLQTTRLSKVMTLAEIISRGIIFSLAEYNRDYLADYFTL